MPRLPLVEQEIEDISAIAASSSVHVAELSHAPTINEVVEALPAAQIVHLACHGVQSSTNALDSGFYLHNGRLTIAQLMELELGQASLAFLSACETAKGDARQPDQIVHLAAAMLFVGFRSVVATMWCVVI
jgi:CHAT domain-containing protein